MPEKKMKMKWESRISPIFGDETAYLTVWENGLPRTVGTVRFAGDSELYFTGEYLDSRFWAAYNGRSGETVEGLRLTEAEALVESWI